MSNLPILKKQLESTSTQASSLLQALDSLFGCTYLSHPQASVIAVLPSHYSIADEQGLKHYKRDGIQHYQLTSKVGPITELVSFKQKMTQQGQAGFSGGYIGLIDYNYAASQNIQCQATAQPQFYLGCYLSYLKLEHQQWYFYSHEENAEALFELVQQQLKRYPFAQADQQTLQASGQTPHRTPFQLMQVCEAVWSKQQYQTAFDKIQDYICAGDCYQINLTQKFSGLAQGQLLDIAQDLWQLTNAPYSAYLKLHDFELLSCSPELFIEFGENRQLITKPIKGTMPRDGNPIIDADNKQRLIDSEKDRAENLMIVDLLRNDLSTYAEIGTVKTPKLFEIESFNQVHHMVSEIRATLKAEINPLELLMSALPGGSITGAPKIRAMQIIEELESGPRGAYCGSMGYFNLDGTGSWNILIRSIQKFQDEVNIWAGGGITIASDCDAEYQECLDKVSAMLDLLNSWQHPKSH